MILAVSICLLLLVGCVDSGFISDWITAFIDYLQWKKFEKEYFDHNQDKILNGEPAPINISELRMHAIRDECLRMDGQNGICELQIGTLEFRKIYVPVNPIQAYMMICKDNFSFTGTKEDSNVVYGLQRDQEFFHITMRHELLLPGDAGYIDES